MVYPHCGLVILNNKIFLNPKDGIQSSCVWIHVSPTKTMVIVTDNCTFRDLCVANIWKGFQLGFQSWEWLSSPCDMMNLNVPLSSRWLGGVSCTIYWYSYYYFRCKHVTKHTCLEPLWEAGNLISLGNHLMSPTDWKPSILPFPPWYLSALSLWCNSTAKWLGYTNLSSALH